jgi:hypothetical protein
LRDLLHNVSTDSCKFLHVLPISSHESISPLDNATAPYDDALHLHGLFPKGPAEKLKKSAIPRQYNLTFQENMSMKRMFLIFGFVALASIAASAAPVTYQFDGYCDSMTINLYGVPKTIFGGTHNFGDCANNFNIGGFKHGVATVYQTGTGAVIDAGDPLFGLFGVNASLQFLINKNNLQCSWIIYSGSDGVGNYVVNVGTCTKVVGPIKRGAGVKSSAGR